MPSVHADRNASGARRRRRLVLALAAAGLMAVTLGAFAREASAVPYIDGIADQNLGSWNGNFVDGQGLFNAPFFDYFQQDWVGTPPSHILYARFVTAPDAIAQGGTCESNLFRWYSYVTSLHLTPVIAVWDVAEGGCADNGAPSSAKYTTDMQQLTSALSGLGTTLPYLEAWNEPNDSGISAANAATYWKDASSVCATAGCTALAGDFVDTADQSEKFNPTCTPTLTFNNLKSYEVSYVKGLGSARPAIWAFHPYLAVNCANPASVATFAANLPTSSPPPQIWFTEVAAWECFDGQTPPRGTAAQNTDAIYLTNNLMAQVAANPPTHVFWYELAANGYTQNCAKYTDSALYEANTAPGVLLARPAAQTVYGPDTELTAATGAATAVSSTQETLNGTEVPGGIYEGNYSFRYGRTKSYGSQTATVALGPGLSPLAISTTISGLTPGTTYHYELVATDSQGLTKLGGDSSFVTTGRQVLGR
jgi:hypothetical protein